MAELKIAERVQCESDELQSISTILRREADSLSLVTELSVIEVLGDRLQSVVRSHNTPSVILHFIASDKPYVLKIEFGQASTMRREIQWYHDAVRVGLPCGLLIVSHVGTSFVFLILRRFGDSSTVDDAALAGAPGDRLEHHIAWALSTDTRLFERTRVTVALDQAHRLNEDRFNRRREQSMSYPYLRHLLSAKSVDVNGEGFHSPAWCWERINNKRSVVEYLTPLEVGLTFGDLHCGNILISESATEVIDPRGGPLLPITYDYGKIIQSVAGGYGAIMAGQYTLRLVGDRKYEISIDTPSGYTEIANAADHCGQRRYLQSLYQAALHFSAMLPHHASEPGEATALYLSGTLLFNQLIKRLG